MQRIRLTGANTGFTIEHGIVSMRMAFEQYPNVKGGLNSECNDRSDTPDISEIAGTRS
jgi:hypothetical protein